jgi:hypothetical protein
LRERIVVVIAERDIAHERAPATELRSRSIGRPADMVALVLGRRTGPMSG